MDFFNVGTSELVFLLLLAILLVGPKRAVELVQQVRRLAARLQREWAAVQRDVLTEVQLLKQETLAAAGPALQEDLQRIAEETKALEREVVATGEAGRLQVPGGGVVVSSPETLGPGEDKAG
ncbi:MAG TPA: hypothetical protein EYH30_10915 [Anaerolineales bacterium]|nr:hypothetical protein [Anaerolineales bacterium]